MATTNLSVNLTRNGLQDQFDPQNSSSAVSGLAYFSGRKFCPVTLYLVGGLPGLVLLAWLPCQAAVVPLGVKLATQQQLVMNNGAEVATLDPHGQIGVAEENVLHDLLEGLVSVDDQGQVRPAVATHWQVSPDQQCWTFYLRPTARWSTGEPLTAEDFVYSWRRLADPRTASPNASYLQDLQLTNSTAVINRQQPPEALGVTALDPQTLQLQLEKPLPYLPAMLAHPVLYPLHQRTVEHYQGSDEHHWTAASHFVGNGAYQIQQWIMNEKLVLSRSPNYWDHANTVIHAITYLTLCDAAIDLRRWQAGEIDITNTIIPTAYLLQYAQDPSSSGVHITPALSLYGYKLNTRKPPFNDKRVRQALTLGLDRQALVSVNRVATLLGQTTASSVNSPKLAGFIPPQPSWTKGSLQQRQHMACQWLREAGYSSKRPLRFTLLYNTAPLHEQWAIAVRAQWKKCFGLMIDITLESEEWRVFLKSSHSEGYQAARFFWTSAYHHPSALLNLFYSPHNRSGTFWHSPAFDGWMEQALHSRDDAERGRCYQQAELILAEEAPVIPLYHSDRVRLVKPYVGGLSKQNPMNAIYTKNLYLIEHPQGPSRYRQ